MEKNILFEEIKRIHTLMGVSNTKYNIISEGLIDDVISLAVKNSPAVVSKSWAKAAKEIESFFGLPTKTLSKTDVELLVKKGKGYKQVLEKIIKNSDTMSIQKIVDEVMDTVEVEDFITNTSNEMIGLIKKGGLTKSDGTLDDAALEMNIRTRVNNKFPAETSVDTIVRQLRGETFGRIQTTIDDSGVTPGSIPGPGGKKVVKKSADIITDDLFKQLESTFGKWEVLTGADKVALRNRLKELVDSNPNKTPVELALEAEKLAEKYIKGGPYKWLKSFLAGKPTYVKIVVWGIIIVAGAGLIRQLIGADNLPDWRSLFDFLSKSDQKGILGTIFSSNYERTDTSCQKLKEDKKGTNYEYDAINYICSVEIDGTWKDFLINDDGSITDK